MVQTLIGMPGNMYGTKWAHPISFVSTSSSLSVSSSRTVIILDTGLPAFSFCWASASSSTAETNTVCMFSSSTTSTESTVLRVKDFFLPAGPSSFKSSVVLDLPLADFLVPESSTSQILFSNSISMPGRTWLASVATCIVCLNSIPNQPSVAPKNGENRQVNPCLGTADGTPQPSNLDNPNVRDINILRKISSQVGSTSISVQLTHFFFQLSRCLTNQMRNLDRFTNHRRPVNVFSLIGY